MNKNNFKSVYPLLNSLYGISMDEDNFEEVALNGWSLIGNKNTRLYRYRADIVNGRVTLPCNVDIIEAVYSSNVDAMTSSNTSATPNIYNQYVEE